MKAQILLLIFFVSCLNASKLITPIPIENSYNKNIAQLGKMLFNDPIISKDGKISCSLCHIKSAYYTNHLKTPIGKNGYVFLRNTISLVNEKYKYYYEWDGRFTSLEVCIESALKDKHETDLSPEEIVKKLKNTEYEKMFENYFKEGLNKKNLLIAFSEFLKSLTTPNSPFDKYLRGDKNAISSEAKRGYELFVAKGCIACHNGMLLGGNVITKIGFMKSVKTNDKGRYEITHNPNDLFYFKVPSLRNVAKTYPYLHDGSVKTLKDIVRRAIEYQLNQHLKEYEVNNIVEFLKSLTGELSEK